MATPGTPFGLPDTSYGPVNRACSGDYFGQIDTLAHAQTIAQTCDMIKYNISQAINGTGNINHDGLNGFALNSLTGNMIDVAGSKLKVALPYCKGNEINEGASFYPPEYYAHSGSYPGGPLILAFGSSIYVGQPDQYSVSFADPRGWTSHTFKEQRARDSWSIVSKYNTVNGQTVLNGVYYDSIGTGTYKTPNTQIDPNTGIAYTKAGWFAEQMHMPDEAAARRPASNNIIIGNFLKNGSAYFPLSSTTSSSIPLAHTDGGFAEGWLRNNNANANAFPTFAGGTGLNSWQKDVDMVIDANLNQGKCVWLVCNTINSVAGGKPSSTVLASWTAAAFEQWRRFAIATYHIARRNATWFEFVVCDKSDSVVVQPWNETHPYYSIDTGPPIDTAANAAASTFGSIQGRRFQNAVALVNLATTPKAVVADRAYTDPITATKYGPGASITVPPQSGLMLVTTTGVGTAPALTITAPADNSTAPAGSVTVQATATSAAGISAVQVRNNGGAWLSMSGGQSGADFPVTFPLSLSPSNIYARAVPVVSGLNTIDVRATDASGSSLTTTKTVHVNFNLPPANTVAPIIELSPGGGGEVTSCLSGDVLRVTTGTWTGSPTFTYQWVRGATAPAGQTSQTYTAVAGDVGHTLTCQVTATNGGGTVTVPSNGVSVATTPVTAPAVIAITPSPIGSTTATLQGTVNPEGAAISDWHFEYGPTTGYGTTTPAQTLPSGLLPVTVTAQITGLTPNTVYHFALVATNSGGTSTSADVPFQSAATSPAGGGGVPTSPLTVTTPVVATFSIIIMTQNAD